MTEADNSASTNRQTVWTTSSGNDNNDSNAKDTGMISAIKFVAMNPGGAELVGIQSKFRRKYVHKSIYIALSSVIALLVVGLILMAIFYRLSYKNVCVTKECVRSATNLLQSMNASVDPCTDFYSFSCGNWDDEHPHPDHVLFNDWFILKQMAILRETRQFLESNGSDAEPLSVGQARTMYRACLDTDAMDALGLQPIVEYLRLFELPVIPRIFNLTSAVALNRTEQPFDWVRTVALIKRTMGSDRLIGFDIMAEPTNNTRKVLAMGAPTLTMSPFKTDLDKRRDRIRRQSLKDAEETKSEEDGEDEISAKVIAAHRKYMTKLISAFIFYADPTVAMADLMPVIENVAAGARGFEKSLAKIQEDIENATVIDQQNPLADLIYTNVAAMQTTSDQLIAPATLPIWLNYLGHIFETTPPAKRINITVATPLLSSDGDVQYLQQVVQLIHETPAAWLEFYVWWSVVDELASDTTNEIRQLHDDYYESSMTALESGMSRSMYCTMGVHQLYEWAVSYAFVDGAYVNRARSGIEDMLRYTKRAFEQLVRSATWMDDETKFATLEKSLAMRSQIGYPAWLANATALDEHYADVAPMNETQHLANMVAVLRWTMARELLNANEPDDPEEWSASPATLNAFYSIQENIISIPLAILQFPFYNLGIEALNYGTIGSFLGHELTHGFDNSGRMFDKDGNMRQWWSNHTVTEYVNRTSCFIQQYDQFYVEEVDQHISGEKTLGENIADNGGLREAFLAYQLYVQKNGREKTLPGLERYTGEQLFFMAYGNVWCNTQTTVSLQWALQDSHCPDRIRLTGTLHNSPEFAATFGCAANTPMSPLARCRIW